MSALRAVASIGMIIFHWYFGAVAGFDEEATVRAARMPGDRLWQLALGFFDCLDWATLLFLCMSGYSDSRRPPEGLLKLNVLVIIVYIAMAWPIPHLTSSFQHDILHNSSFVAWCGEHRWYLKYYVLCNILHSVCFRPLQDLLSRASIWTQRLIPLCIVLSIGTVTFFIADLYQQTPEAFKVCRSPPGFPNKWSALPAGQNPFDNWLYVVSDDCEIIDWINLPNLLIYSMCWWYVPILVDFLQNHSGPQMFTFAPVFCFATLLSISLLDTWIIASLGRESLFLQYSLSLLVIGCLVAIVTTLADCFWFPLKFLSWLGNYSLSTYLFHLTFTSVKDGRPHMTFFAYRNHVLIPSPEDALQYIHGSPALTALVSCLVNLAYAIIWMSTFGVLFQYCLVRLALFLDLLIRGTQDVFQLCVRNFLK